MTQVTLEQAIAVALGHHQAGRLAEAEGIYRQVLAQHPDHADGLHLLGVLACQTGHPDTAVELIGRATALNPDIAEYHSNLGEALRRSGQSERAVASLQRAIELNPDLTDAHYNLGVACIGLGRFLEAIGALGRAIALHPDHAEAHNNLGVALRETGRYEEAIAALRRAIALKPHHARAHANLGLALHDAGRLQEAIAALRRSLELGPEDGEVYNGLGNALCDAGRLDEAIDAYNRALERNPAHAEARSNRGVALRDSGRLDEAMSDFDRCLTLKPDHVAAWNNLGLALNEKGRVAEAIDALGRAIALKPDHAEAHNNLGIALFGQGRLDEAIAAHDRSLALEPGYAAAHNNRGNVLKETGRLEEAIRAYERALELTPGYAIAHSNLLLCSQFQASATAAGLAGAHAGWDEQHAAPHRTRVKARDLDRDPGRPLRLGFVSPDLRRHPVGYFLVRALENLDGRAFAVVCYSGSSDRDDLSGRLAAASNAWRGVAGLDDDALAAQIRSDRIDILFDLSGHTAGHRLLVFARRPAPIQITWIGYVGTTGVRTMDYLIADRYHVPQGSEAHYCEQILRMPDGYICFDPPADSPVVGPLPAGQSGRITFGSFNNLAKITPEVIAVWAEIVRRVPGSTLLLAAPGLESSGARERLGRAFVAAGALSVQVELRGRMSRSDLLSAYNAVDLALDPFPYSGGVTTCEALWMGVPVVTCPGETFASRHSLSHLANAGLTETVAEDRRDYVERAVALAADLPRLGALRAGLRGRMAHSPLCDGERFARNLMNRLRDVWRQWCRE
jgi:predicted O-linked N-acetylglucosamine transferase (SPINDLY family)